MRRTRTGSGLLELLVALPVMALLGVVVVQLLISVHRQVLRTDGAAGASRELRHGAGVLVAELRVIQPVDLVAWSDTAVEFEGLVGVGVVCAAAMRVADLAILDADSGAHVSQPLATMWNQPAQAGDRVDYWLAGTSPADSVRAETRALRSVSHSNDCAQSPLAPASAGSLRIALNDTISGAVMTGSVVRVLRRTRYSLYRAGDGDWYLGRRTRGAVGWDVIQPVAGPLHAPRDRGMLIRVLDAAGARLDSAAGSEAARVRFLMRAPQRAGRAAPSKASSDSVTFEVALRAFHGRAP
jgi:hypothetical protein